MRYKVILSAKAVKILGRLDRKTEQRIQARLEELADHPLETRLSKQMETAPARRYCRVGDWRLIFEVDEASQQILVITIQHRSRVYREIKR